MEKKNKAWEDEVERALATEERWSQRINFFCIYTCATELMVLKIKKE